MRAVVEINHLTGMPVPVIDGDGKIVGVVGTAEILGGLLPKDMPKRDG